MNKPKNGLVTKVVDLKIFGEKENRIITASPNSSIEQYSLDFEQKRAFTCDYKLDWIRERNEMPESIAVCSKNKCVMLATKKVGIFSLPVSSRLFVFKLTGDKIVQKACIDQFEQSLPTSLAQGCFGYFGSLILWFGLTSGDNGVVELFQYDTDSGEFLELEDKRVLHRANRPEKLDCFDGKYYYTGWNGQLMRLSWII